MDGVLFQSNEKFTSRIMQEFNQADEFIGNKYDLIYWIRIYKNNEYTLTQLEAMSLSEIRKIYEYLLLPNTLF